MKISLVALHAKNQSIFVWAEWVYLQFQLIVCLFVFARNKHFYCRLKGWQETTLRAFIFVRTRESTSPPHQVDPCSSLGCLATIRTDLIFWSKVIFLWKRFHVNLLLIFFFFHFTKSIWQQEMQAFICNEIMLKKWN